MQAQIADFNGNRSDLASVAFTIDTVRPAAPDPTRIQVTEPEAGTVTVTGAAGSVEPNAVLIIINTRVPVNRSLSRPIAMAASPPRSPP